MKVAHIVHITPGKCGLYETTWELIAGCRALGFDSRLVDLDPAQNKVGFRASEDRGVPVADHAWAKQADVIVSHSGIGNFFDDVKHRRFVYVAHGRPKVSYLSEKTGKLALYSYFFAMNYDPKWAAVVTFWPEHVGHLEAMFPMKRVVSVPSPVDLGYWKPGPADYDFGGKRGEINAILVDPWREDEDPFDVVHAFALWARAWKMEHGHEPRQQLPAGVGPKLHLYGKPKSAPGADVLVARLGRDHVLGEIVPWKDDLRPVYRSADFALTPHRIAVRARREAMACGCPVVTVDERLEIRIPEETRAEIRLAAARRFDPTATAKAFAELLETMNAEVS